MQPIIGILACGMQWGIETAFLLLALWVMVRIQKLQYTVLGLAVAAGIACGLDLIPFVGHYIALPVLWVCLTKVTREDFTGVVFTAAVSYALVFAMNLFVLGALMGDLRSSARARTATDDEILPAIASEEEVGVASAAPVDQDQSMAAPAPQQPAEASTDKELSNIHPGKLFAVKSITQNGKQSMAMLSTGVKNYTMALGETIVVETSEGQKSVRLEQVETDSILLDFAGQPLKLAAEPSR